MTGNIPFPSFPVLSATNCSNQSPKLSHRGEEKKKVSLSLPFWAKIPKVVPRRAPSLSLRGVEGEHFWEAIVAFSKRSDKSIPKRAAGTRPKKKRQNNDLQYQEDSKTPYGSHIVLLTELEDYQGQL